jgi:hypothetical protein
VKISRVPLLACLIVVAVLFLVGAGRAATILRNIRFTPPEIDLTEEAATVSVAGCPEFGEPGKPLLPSYALRVLLPCGEAVERVEADVLSGAEISLGAVLKCGEVQSPMAIQDVWERTMPDPGIYESDVPFPAARAVHVTTQTYRGYNIAFFRVYPVTYVGSEKKILFSCEIKVRIETVPDTALLNRSLATFRPGVPGDLLEVERVTGDVAAAATYGASPQVPLSTLIDPSDTYPYVIITTSTLEPAFQILADHKTSRGLRTKIVRISEVVWNYEGIDLADRIRKFLLDAYLFWETEYVLLGGDDEVCPHRGLYAEILPYVTDKDIPAEIYFGGLDGTWNDDMDGRWGERGEDDLLPEVSVGRAPVNTVTEATNFVNKVVKYETAPVVGQIKIGQMAGELVYDEPTWGGDSKDEIKGGSSAHGFTTAGFPPSFTVHTLYDRDLYPDEWTKYDLIALLNSGRHLVNHAGHCINWQCLKIHSSDIPTSFTNDGVTNSYFIIYAHGCYSAAFDNRTTDGSYVGDAVAEYFTFIENGAVAYIGNTRYGCGFHGDTRSAAQYYDRQFFDALFGEGVTAIGKAQDDSKIDNIPYIDFRGMRWTYYTLALMADPAMDIWTDTPDYLMVDLPDTIHLCENDIEIVVTRSGNPAAGARVSIFGDSTYSCHGYTGANGVVRLDPGAAEVGSLYVAVTAHNCYSYLDTVPVTAASGPLATVEAVAVDDDTSGASSGDADGKPEAGETIETVISLRNVGQAVADDPFGILRTGDPNITVLDSAGMYADIPPGGVVAPAWRYTYLVSPETPDSHAVMFELALTYSDTAVVRHYSQTVSAPSLRVTGIAVCDTLYGNGDGCLEATETVEITLALTNYGSGDAHDVSVGFAESDPYAELVSDSSYIAGIDPGGQAQTSPPFLLSLLPGCPRYHTVDLTVSISASGGGPDLDSVSVDVGGLLEDDFEGAPAGWTHEVIVMGFVDQWHIETYRNHSPAGAYCWKFGGPGSEGYVHYAHGALVTPQLCLGPNSTLSFWHWIQVERESGDYVSDGGVVEISTDGGDTWSQLTPVGGYTHRIYPGTSTPLPAETPCFGWTDDWTEVVFDLAAYEGSARVRFNFGGGEHFESEEGWYVDDILVTDDYASIVLDGTGAEVVPDRFALRSLRPNPCHSQVYIAFDVPRASQVSIEAFDIRGRKLTTIAIATYAPGRYSVAWCPGGYLAPGVYFIRMRACGYAAIRKLVVY